MGIVIENVNKSFGEFQALADINLTIETGALVALLGPSGSGKSTLLRMISGLEMPDQGKIFLTGRDATYQSVQERNIGFVFQHYALFKHMTVRQNIGFGLEIRKAEKDKVRRRVSELIELVQLGGLGDRFPSQLSGGQRQRVALARALAVEPKVMLLDEPFGALDAKVRKDLRSWVRRLHEEVHVTTVIVTHDQEEAMELADYIVVMNKGRIEQIGTPAEIYDHPASSFVMSFIGPVNVLAGTSALLRHNGIHAADPEVFLRPHDIEVDLVADGASVGAVVGRVIHLGWEVQVELKLDDGQVLNAHLSRDRVKELNLEPEMRVYAKSKETKAFPLNYSI